MTGLNLVLLGGFQLRAADQRVLALGPKKGKALLAYLALQPARRCDRDRLAALLWAESSDAQARQSLRQVLAELRRALASHGPVLVTEGQEVALAADALEVDAALFEQRLSEATPAALDQAIGLYRGEFLEGFNPRAPAFEDWLMAERTRLRERALDAMQTLLDRELASGASERAVQLALRLLGLDPLREAVQRSLMELYARQGRYPAALRQYRVCQQVLRRELDVAPEAATQDLYRRLFKRRRTAETDAPAAEASRGEAPVPAAPPELRQASVLMAWIGAGGDDPEAAHERQRRAHGRIDEVVHRYGGRAVQRLGDSLLSVFGVLPARGSDAERAVGAAAAIQAAGLADIRIGLASGRVMTSGGDGSSVTGEALNRAGDLAARAGPEEVLLDAALRARLAGRIEAEPVDDGRIWRLRALRAAPAGQSAFVGRDSERRQLGASLESCRETGSGQSLLIRGEAGIGKSRLLAELAAMAGQQGFACHQVLVLDFGAEQDPVRALVRSLLGLASTDGPARRQAAAGRALADGLVDANAQGMLHDLLDLPQAPLLQTEFAAMDDAIRRARRQRLVIDLIAACARAQPLLLAVEDIHWADTETLDYLARIASAVVDGPALLVMTHRVEGEPLDPAWRGAMYGAPLTTIDLGPLRGEELQTLAAALADEGGAFVRRCIDRAGGNPLFLEQLLQSPAEDESVPDTVRSIVWARLDRLGAADRHAAQAAAVLGQRFEPAALRHLLDDREYDCAALAARHLLRPDGEHYQFGHALIRDGIYDSLLASRRRALHERAADWFCESDPPLAARHLDRAESGRAASAYLAAARHQVQAHRYEQARTLLARGLELARDDAERHALHQLHGDVLHTVGAIDEAMDAHRLAVDLAADDEQRCQGWFGLAAAYGVKDRHHEALAALDEAERLAGDRPRSLAQLQTLRGNLLFPLGRLANCLNAHQRARRHAREADSPELEARALSGLGDGEYLRGRMISAHGHFDRCIELCARQGFARIEAANRPMRAVTAYFQNHLGAAYEDAREASELAARIGHLRAETLARDALFYVLAARAEWSAAREQAAQGLALARRLGAPRFEADFRLNLAVVLAAEGQQAAAEQQVEEAYAFSREASLAFAGPWILGALAEITDDPDKRRRALAEGESLLAAGSVSHNHLNFYQLAIEAALKDADWPAVEHYGSALEAYTRAEPLPWSDFFIARGRALAAWHSGRRDAATRQALERLAGAAERDGLRAALHALATALAEG